MFKRSQETCKQAVLIAACSSFRKHNICRKVGVVNFTDTNNAALGISLYKDYDGWGSPGLQLSLAQPSYGGSGGKRAFNSGRPLKRVLCHCGM